MYIKLINTYVIFRLIHQNRDVLFSLYIKLKKLYNSKYQILSRFVVDTIDTYFICKIFGWDRDGD